jgi:hypothetical protein
MLLKNYSLIFDFPYRIKAKLKIKEETNTFYISANKALRVYNINNFSFIIEFEFFTKYENYYVINKAKIDAENLFAISPITVDEHYDGYYIKVKTFIIVW